MEYSDLPQNRERIYIIGLANEKDIKFFNIYDEYELAKFQKNRTEKERLFNIKKNIYC